MKARYLRSCALAALVTAAATACTPRNAATADAPPSTAGGGPGVEVDARNRALWLVNGGREEVYFTAFERQFAALVNWVPCGPPVRCPGVPPGGRTRVAFDSIPGYQAGAREAIVFWWKLRPAPDGSVRPDSVRSRVVALGGAAAP